MNFRFSLTDFTFNPAGVTTIIKPPIDFDKMKIKSSRDFRSHGVFFEITDITLGFVDDGYNVIDLAYQSKGCDAETELLVEIKCSDTDTYEQFYTGVLRYAEIKYILGDFCRIEIPCQQTGCVQTFKNRIEQKVDLESLETFDGDALTAYDIKREITFPGKPLVFIDAANIESYSFLKKVVEGNYNGVSIELFNWDYGILFTKCVRSDRTSFAPDTNDFDNGIPILIVDDFTDISCGNTSGNVKIRVSLNIDLAISFATDGIQYLDNAPCGLGDHDPARTVFKVKLIHADSTGTPISTQDLYSSQQCIAIGNTNININIPEQDVPFSVNSNDQIYLTLSIKGTAVVNIYTNTFYNITPTFNSGEFAAVMQFDCPSSPANVFLVNESLSRITESITNNCLKVYSDYFGRTDSEPFTANTDGCGSLESITNGLFIRQFVLFDNNNCSDEDSNSRKLFISFKEMFDGLNAIHNIGMGVDAHNGQEVMRIEDVPFFYPFVVGLEINDPMEIKIEFDTKRVFSIAKIGYQKWESEFNGGLDEIQTKREYRTESKAVNSDKTDKGGGTLEQNSKFIASTYAIEVTRRQDNSAKDWRYDNDIFIICLKRGYDSLEVETPSSLAFDNLLSSSNLLNIRISPVRNLLRWFKTIAASWTKQWATAGRLIFTSGEGNYIAGLAPNDDDCYNELYVNNVDLLYENQTVKRDLFKTEERGKPLWEPELIKFDAPLSWQNWKLLKANPYKLIKVTKGSNVYYGWQEEISYPPEEGGLTNFTLLRAFDAENRI